MQRGACLPLPRSNGLDASSVLDVHTLRPAYFRADKRQGELKRSASYTLLPAFLRLAAGVVRRSCGSGGGSG